MAVVFDLPDTTYVAHNELRPGRQVQRDAVLSQAGLMRRALAAIPAEGFSEVYVLRQPPAPGVVSVERVERP